MVASDNGSNGSLVIANSTTEMSQEGMALPVLSPSLLKLVINLEISLLLKIEPPDEPRPSAIADLKPALVDGLSCLSLYKYMKSLRLGEQKHWR